MSKCKSCGRGLNAINISDIEPEWCNKCAEIKIKMINPIKEDPEFYGISDKDLNEMSRMLWPFPGTGVNGYRQNLDQFKPNPIDSKLNYIRKSLQNFEHEISVIKNTYTQDQLKEMSKEWKIIHGFSPFDNMEE